jgi:hypothetical protein
MPSADPMGGFTGMEGVEQAARAPGMYEALADRAAAAVAPLRRPIDTIGQGAREIPGTVADYARDVTASPDPSQRLASDIGKAGSMIWEGVKQDPVGAFLDVVPVISEIRSGMDADKYSKMAEEAAAAGDEKKASMFRQLAAVAAAGTAPLAGTAARLAKRGMKAGVEGAEAAAKAGVREAEDVAEAGAVKAAEEAATSYVPVRQAFEETPDPKALYDDVLIQITKSIEDTAGEKATLPTKTGLAPMYIVDTGVDEIDKGARFLLNETKNANAQKQLAGIDPLLQQYPDMALDPDQWAKAMSQAWGSREVLAPPYRFMKAIKDGEYENLLRSLTPGQIADADAGFANGKEFLKAYTNGQMGVEDTGKLFMWGILSRGVDPFTHEGLFLDAFNGIEQWLKMAADGKFTKEVAEGPYKEWAASVAPKGSGQAGSGAVHNLNAFGRDFLTKMSVPDDSGMTPLKKLHDMMADPNMTGRQIRREFASTGEGVGIDNKVVSFILLATGRDDVMVIDRIQLKNLWDDGRFGDVNIWDGISVPTVKTADGKVIRFAPTDEGRAQQDAFLAANEGSKRQKASVNGTMLAEATYGAKGILVYEALEDAIMKNIAPIYDNLGRPGVASPGRFHWETWVARSNQEASHGTLGSILSKAQGAENPLGGVYSKQGDYQKYAYGAKYGRGPEGSFYDYGLSTGEEIRLSPQQLKTALDAAKNPKYGVVPRGFSVEETVGRPWYEREGVNRARLDDIIRAAASGQEIPVRKAAGGSVPDGAGRAGDNRKADGSARGKRALGDIQRALVSFRKLAAEHNINKPQLAYMIRQKTPDMPRERAALYAQNILSEDILDLSARLERNPQALPVLRDLSQRVKKERGDKLMGDLRRALKDRAIRG